MVGMGKECKKPAPPRPGLMVAGADRRAVGVNRVNHGFTLIELLIVVAIIAILAAIAVPNFLEAQTRSKVSRMKSDARVLATASESYRVDNNKYPYPIGGNWSTWSLRQGRLTTPVAYITSLPRDVFKSIHSDNPDNVFDYEVREYIDPTCTSWCAQDPDAPLTRQKMDVYIRSWGPDQRQALPNTKTPDGVTPVITKSVIGWSLTCDVYDPTNGTVSSGDIWALLPGPIYFPR